MWIALLLTSCLDQPPDDQATGDDEESGHIVVTETSITILEPTTFAVQSAVPLRTDMFDAVAETMLGNPSITLLGIAGHAEPSESDGDALPLARARVAAAALIDRGVAPDAVVTIVAEEPDVSLVIADTPERREFDRRIDFLILERRAD